MFGETLPIALLLAAAVSFRFGAAMARREALHAVGGREGNRL